MEIALTTLILNMRYILMSCALSQKIDKNTPIVHRFLMAYDVTDEIFGLSIMSEGRLDPKYTYGLITISAPSWAIGTYPVSYTHLGVLPNIYAFHRYTRNSAFLSCTLA